MVATWRYRVSWAREHLYDYAAPAGTEEHVEHRDFMPLGWLFYRFAPIWVNASRFPAARHGPHRSRYPQQNCLPPLVARACAGPIRPPPLPLGCARPLVSAKPTHT